MSARRNNHWTPEMLAECRQLYEGGMPNGELGERYGIKAATIAVMAWQREWHRIDSPVRRARPGDEAEADSGIADEPKAINPSLPAGLQEQEFTRRLAVIIQRYWEAQGRPITLEIETMNCGIQCIRSHSINGVPVLPRVRA